MNKNPIQNFVLQSSLLDGNPQQHEEVLGHPKQTFFECVYEVVARIPSGKVVSYGQIAAYLGNPRGARSVGWALSACPEDLPWQRVVKNDGSITGGEWADLRRQLLREEAVDFLLDGRVDMKACRWELAGGTGTV